MAAVDKRTLDAAFAPASISPDEIELQRHSFPAAHVWIFEFSCSVTELRAVRFASCFQVS
jgi:hypothetical protein